MINQDNKKILQNALNAVEAAKYNLTQKKAIENIGKDLVQILTPLLQQIATNSQVSKAEMKEVFREIFKEIKIDSPKIDIKPNDIKIDAPIIPPIKIPDIKIPDIKIPEIKFPSEVMIGAIKEAFKGIKFNQPEIKIPENWYKQPLKIEKIEELIANLDKLATAKLNLDLGNINRDNPLPVILTDEKGQFYKAIQTAITTASGGMSAGSLIGWIQDNLSIGPNHSLAVNVSGATGTLATNIVDSSGVAYSGSNPMPVLGTFTGGATYFASQAIVSTNAIQFNDNPINTDIGYSYPGTLRVVHATDAAISVNVIAGGAGGGNAQTQVRNTGNAWTDVGFDSDNANEIMPITIMKLGGVVNSSNVNTDKGYSYPGTIRVVHATDVGVSVYVAGATGSLAATLVDSSGVGYSGSNPLPVDATVTPGATYYASDAIGSTNIVQIKGVAINTDQGYSYPATMRVVHATDVGVSTNVLSLPAITGTVAVSGITASSAVSLIDSSGIGYSGSNPVPVTGTFVSGATYFASQAVVSTNIIEINGQPINTDKGYSYPSTLRVVHATDVAVSTSAAQSGIWSVGITGATGTLAAAIVDSSGVQYSSSNPVPIDDAGGAITVDASNLDIRDLDKASDSVEVWQAYHDNLNANVNLQVADTDVAVGNAVPVKPGTAAVFPVSGTVAVSGVTGSLAATIIDSSGVGYSGSNPVPAKIISSNTGLSLGVKQVSGAIDSVYVTGVATSISATIIDSSGVGYSGTNPMPVNGSVAHDSADANNPLKIGGKALQANITPVAANDRVNAVFDDLGRQVMKVHQVRDMIATAYVSLTNGTETTLLAAAAGYYHDLLYIMGSNTSSVSANVAIRPRTGGNIIMTLVIPGGGTAGVSLPVAIPQGSTDYTGNNWTADMDDITGTTVYLSALFSKEL